MRKVSALLSIASLALAWGQAHCADSPYSPLTPQGTAIMQPGTPSTVQMLPGANIVQGDKPATPQVPAPPAPGQPASQAPTTDSFGAGPPAGTGATAGFNPQMLGDSIPYVAVRSFSISQNSFNSSSSAHAPIYGLGQFKIADNESPRPEDRAFFYWNGYSRVDATTNGGPGAPKIRTDEYTFGAEKTFLDGDASVEIRLPVAYIGGDAGNSTDFGDITLVGKAALINDHDTGTVVTAGLALTLPTGPSVGGFDGSKVNPTLIQPYVGYLFNFTNELYLQGFSSLVFPCDDHEGTLWFADAGVGYMISLSDDGWLRAIVPTTEAHLTVAFGHEGAVVSSGVGSPDQLVLTEGVHLVGPRHSTITLGWGFPVTGPRLFASEWQAQLNLRF